MGVAHCSPRRDVPAEAYVLLATACEGSVLWAFVVCRRHLLAHLAGECVGLFCRWFCGLVRTSPAVVLFRPGVLLVLLPWLSHGLSPQPCLAVHARGGGGSLWVRLVASCEVGLCICVDAEWRCWAWQVSEENFESTIMHGHQVSLLHLCGGSGWLESGGRIRTGGQVGED